MSKFLKALEQAERDRAHGERAREPPPASSAAAVPRDPVVPIARSRETLAPESLSLEQSPGKSPPIVELDLPPTSDDLDGIEGHLVSLLEPTAFETEQYRNLRTVLEAKRTGHGYVVAVSSPSVGDGKTTTAINLAGVLAEDEGARILLVDADLRDPAVDKRLGMKDARDGGLVAALLAPALSLEDVVAPRPPFRLSVLPAGRRVASPYEMLKSPRFGELLEAARQQFDYVVLDTPPLVSLSDCRLIGSWVDGFLIVVAAHSTPRKLVEEALNVLEPAKVVGFVFNNNDRASTRYAYRRNGTASVRPGHRASTDE
jgi:capsular exopolysaccharide synthesis family protein